MNSKKNDIAHNNGINIITFITAVNIYISSVYVYPKTALKHSLREINKSPRAQRRSPGYKVQISNKIFKALSLTVAE